MAATAGRQVGRLWAAELAGLILAVVQGAVLARGLGVRSYGVYAVITTFSTLVFVILDPRSADAVTKYTSVFRRSNDEGALLAVVKFAFVLDLVCGLLAAMITFGLSGLLPALGVEGANVTLVAIAAAGGLLSVPSSSGRAALGAFSCFRTIAGIQVGLAVLRAIVTIPVALLFDLQAVFVAFTCVAAVEGACYLVAVDRATTRAMGRSPRTGRLSSLRGHRREITGFLAYADAGTLAGSFVKQADVIAVSAVSDSTVAGYYRLAKSLTSPAGNIGGPIQAVIFPRLTDAAAEDDPARFRVIVRRTFAQAALPLAVGALLAVPLCGPVIRLLAGDDFASATGLAQILVIGVALSFVTLPLRPAYLALGHNASFAWNAVLTATLALVGFLVLGPTYGAAGIAWSKVLSVALGATILFVLMLRFVRRDGYRRPSKPPLPLAVPAVEAE